jgi:DNA polymerase-3 subunit epsilon
MNQTYNILDFETTGLSADYDRVIEVGVIKVKDNVAVARFEALVNTGTRISSMITGLTGITNDMVKDAKSSQTVFTNLLDFVKDEPIVAHNASFDSRFYFAEMRRAGFNTNNNFICSLLLSRRLLQSLDSHKLGNICKHLGYTNKAAHRALGDVEVTLKVFQELLTQIRQRTNIDTIAPEFLTNLTKVQKKKVKDWLSMQEVLK